MELSIRPAREDDAESIVEVLNPLIEEGIHTAMAEPVSVRDEIEFIRSFPRRGVFNVAVCSSSLRVVGLQDVVPIAAGSSVFRHVGEISTFVSLSAQRRGVARRLSEATFKAARDLGFIKLLATIRADNPRALAFYGSLGFRVIGTAERHAFIRGKYVDEVFAETFLA